MKALIIALVLLLSNTQAHSSQEAREACAFIKNFFSEVHAQLPLQVDYMTRLIGITPMYIPGKCLITVNYSINEDTAIREFIRAASAESNGRIVPTRQEAVEAINKPSARRHFRAYMINKLSPDLHAMTELPGVSLRMNYAYDGNSLKPLVVEFP